jgi:hypothetical protein
MIRRLYVLYFMSVSVRSSMVLLDNADISCLRPSIDLYLNTRSLLFPNLALYEAMKKLEEEPTT